MFCIIDLINQNIVKTEMQKLTGIELEEPLPTSEEVDEAWERYRALGSESDPDVRELKLLPRLDQTFKHSDNKTFIDGVVNLVYDEVTVSAR